MGGAQKEQKPAFEYTAQASSPIANGEVKVKIDKNAMTMAALFTTVEIAYAEISELKMADYAVTIRADSGDYVLTRMGNWCRPFYDALCDAYNQAVLRSMFISGDPILTAKGEFSYSETADNNAMTVSALPAQRMGWGALPIHVYENSVAVLPPDMSARRVPLCFVTGMDKGDYELTLKLGTGESYTCAKLGYETVPFARAVEKQIRSLREKTLAAVREIDHTLTAMQASQLAGLMPQGAAAPIGRISGIAPSFVEALERKIAATRAGESYKVFKDLCDPALIWVGFREADDRESADREGDDRESADREGDNRESADGDEADDSQLSVTDLQLLQEGAGKAADPWLLWMIAPSPDGRFAAVEFAVPNSATFIYRTGGDFASFAMQLNRALEAISFKREVIRLTDAQLRLPENSDYYMAAKRIAALKFIRSGFKGRIIHSGIEYWKQKLTEMLIETRN